MVEYIQGRYCSWMEKHWRNWGGDGGINREEEMEGRQRRADPVACPCDRWLTNLVKSGWSVCMCCFLWLYLWPCPAHTQQHSEVQPTTRCTSALVLQMKTHSFTFDKKHLRESLFCLCRPPDYNTRDRLFFSKHLHHVDYRGEQLAWFADRKT